MPTSSTTKSSNRQYLSREVWIKHIADYKGSGLSQSDYAIKHGLVLPTFRNWIHRPILLLLRYPDIPQSSLSSIFASLTYPATNRINPLSCVPAIACLMSRSYWFATLPTLPGLKPFSNIAIDVGA